MSEWVFIATDTSYIGKDFDNDKNMFSRMDCVKTKNIPKEDIGNYQPLCLFYQGGSKDMLGRHVKKIEQESNTFVISGVIMKGRPLPFKMSFSNGESFSFPFLYESGSETKATPIVIDMMDNFDEVINYVKSLQVLYGKELKVAETDLSIKNAESIDDEYMNYLSKMGESHGLENKQPTWLAEYVPSNWKSEYFKQSDFEKGYWAKLRESIQ